MTKSPASFRCCRRCNPPHCQANAQESSPPWIAHELLTRFQLQQPAPAHRLAIGGLSPAAVLIPVVMRDEGLSVLLTRRSPRLRHHGGQISFPGGRQDPGDENLIATALRETEEELGIPARLIEVIGTLNPLNTVSRFEVLPVLGLLDGNYPLILSPDGGGSRLRKCR